MKTKNPNRKLKLALLINMISPARISLYSALADAFDLLILHGGPERNRESWRGVEKQLLNARIKRVWGWKVTYTRKEKKHAFDEQYLHVNPGYSWELLRFAPDIVITSEMGFRTILALLYGALFARPVWVWWGGTLHTERHKAGFLKRTVRAVLARWVRYWISYGLSSTEYLLSLGIRRERILELQNTPDERYFEKPREAQFRLQPKPVLLYVGQFIGRKGVDALLLAAAALQSQDLEFSMLLVGEGREQEALERRARELKLRNVHFRPAQQPATMPSVYCSADALVFPTLEDPWGLVASEAVLAGLPVLCSKYAGCAEELFLKENIFDPQDPVEFQEKLRMLVAGKLPRADPGRVKASAQIAQELIGNLHRTFTGGSSQLIQPEKLSTRTTEIS